MIQAIKSEENILLILSQRILPHIILIQTIFIIIIILFIFVRLLKFVHIVTKGIT